ncbi:MAG: element excision factor XisH family protein [Spirulina sp.]
MPQRDTIHDLIKQALIKDRWKITDDPYVIAYGERFLFIDLGISRSGNALNGKHGQLIGIERDRHKIAVEIKEFRGKSFIKNLEQTIGQYTLYRLLLKTVEPEREVYLAITDTDYEELFNEPIGKLVINELPLKLIIVDVEKIEVKQWIP